MALFEKGQQSSSFGGGQQSSGFGAKPSSVPQKPVEQKPVPSRVAPQRPVLEKQAVSKPVPKKTVQSKPPFGGKKELPRDYFLRQAAEKSYGSGVKTQSAYGREKILKEALPFGKVGPNISKEDVAKTLKDLEHKEYYAKGPEKEKLKEKIRILKRGSGL